MPKSDLFAKNISFINAVNRTMNADPLPQGLTFEQQFDTAIAREGARNNNPELLHQIKQAVLEAVSRFVPVKAEDIAVDLESDREMEVLSVSVSLPDGRRVKG